MEKKASIRKNIIGISLIFWGLLVLAGTIYYLIESWGFYERIYSDFDSKPSVFSAIKNYHLSFLIPLFNMFSGITFILKKKVGWTLATISTLLILVNAIKPLIINYINITNYIIAIPVILIFSIFCYMLISKSLLNYYKPTNKTWLIISVVVVVIISYSAAIEN